MLQILPLVKHFQSCCKQELNYCRIYIQKYNYLSLRDINARRYLLDLYFFPFRFIVKTVDSRDNIAAFKFFVRDVTFRVAGDSDDVSRVVQVDFLAGEETVDNKILRITGIFPVSTGKPFYRVAFLLAFGSGRCYFLWTAVVHVGIGGDKCRGSVIVFPKAVGDALGVP